MKPTDELLCTAKGAVLSVLADILKEIWMVWCQMAPYLMIGFGIAGGLSVFVKPEFVQRHLGKGTFLPVLKTTVLGVPLPLCSCGVIPVAASLRKQGASKGATSSFLLSTPQTGIDSIAVTYSLMGLFFAIFRPLTAFLSGIIGGIIISLSDPDNHAAADDSIDIPDTCCDDNCDASSENGTASNNSPVQKMITALRYGFDVLPRDIGRALILGVFIAGIISALVPPGFFARLPGGQWSQLLFMMVVGIPVYVCATSSVPVAAALILKGVSPGAALVFLITGPATNAAAISTIWKVMGRRTAIIYLAVVAILALLSGILADYLVTQLPEFSIVHSHHHGIRLWEHLAGVALGIILLVNMRPVLPRKPVSNPQSTVTDSDSLSLNVQGMRCTQCQRAIDSDVRNISGVQTVSVDLTTGSVTIQGNAFSHQSVKKAITDLGFKIC